jgi:isopentenyldiphosphate isomerase
LQDFSPLPGEMPEGQRGVAIIVKFFTGEMPHSGRGVSQLSRNILSFVFMSHSKSIEMFPIVDENGNTIGEAPRTVCHDGKSMLLHPVVHLHVFNSKGELFLQKRSITKDIQPGKWDTSVGGHVSPGESVEDALKREAFEELNLTEFVPFLITRYVWESKKERELVNSFKTVTDDVPRVEKDEIDEGRYWSLQEIRDNIGKGIFTPNFENEFKMI